MGNNGSKNNDQALELLLEKVYRGWGYDFRDYKRGTVTRRLQRRLYATGTTSYEEYLRFLESHPQESQSLAEDITIRVSGFFRSRYTFQQVARLVLPRMVAHKIKRGERSLSFWSAACACGEEPYSIAILLADFLGSQLTEFEIAVHASDINRQALVRAEAGLYPPKVLEGLPPLILGQHFSRSGEEYLVNSSTRRMVSFSYFDLVSGRPPPFAPLDCVFCCNVLIYLQRHLQEKVLGLVYDSLATPGYLVLGEVETPTDNLRPRLECINAKAKIYRKTGK
jgi:chemotaxis methyl-accepting protein methylase